MSQETYNFPGDFRGATINVKSTTINQAAFINNKARLELLIQKAYNDNFRQSRLESFVGRVTELIEIKALISEKQKNGGYLTITGQAGQGKSSIIAKIVEERGAGQTAHHFIPFAPPTQYQTEILSSLIATLLIKHDLLDLADAYLVSSHNFGDLTPCANQV